MKATLFKPFVGNAGESPAQIILEPGELFNGDQRRLESILADYETIGHGRHPETGKLLHVSLALTPKKKG